jgi:hypothetical protein
VKRRSPVSRQQAFCHSPVGKIAGNAVLHIGHRISEAPDEAKRQSSGGWLLLKTGQKEEQGDILLRCIVWTRSLLPYSIRCFHARGGFCRGSGSAVGLCA